MNRQVHPMESSRRGDFLRLHSAENGCDRCFCVAWWVPTWEGWGDRTAEENRRLRESLWDRSVWDGYLLYVDGEPAGWCQAIERDRLVKPAADFHLDEDKGTWAIGCFLIAPSHRRRGHAAYLLDAGLRDLPTRGARRIEAYPKRGADLDAEELWNGPESLLRSRGFRVVKDAPVRPVLTLELNAT